MYVVLRIYVHHTYANKVCTPRVIPTPHSTVLCVPVDVSKA